MAKYLVTYDLVGTNETSEDYKHLIDEIKSYSEWIKVQKSVWLIDSSLSAKEIYEYLVPFLDGNDRVLVFRLDTGYWWGRKPIDGMEALNAFMH